MFIASTSYLGDMAPNWFFGIEPNAFGAIGAIVNFVVATVVSKVTPETPEHIQHLVDDIRIPGKSGQARHLTPDHPPA
jgi:cation/acetate symporter